MKITLFSLLLLFFGSQPEPAAAPYSIAYAAAQADGQPLILLVGATWCPACRVLEGDTRILRLLAARGHLAVLDYDTDRPLLRQLKPRRWSLPRLLIFEANADRRHVLTRELIGTTAIRGYAEGTAAWTTSP